MLLKNIDEISKISRLQEIENWDFLSFLRDIGESVELDKVFISIMSQLNNEIDCSQCGNCCRQNLPVLDNRDIERISESIGIGTDDFINEYLHKFTGKDVYIMNRIPCPFLKGNVCSVYEERFDSCRVYPQLLSYSNIVSVGNLIRNTAICPIIFNFYEKLKEKLNFRDT